MKSFRQGLFEEMRLGTIYYGFERFHRASSSRVATRWFILLLMPLFPLGRYRLVYQHSQWQPEERLPLKWISLLRTYAWGWLVAPWALLAPMALGSKELYPLFGLPSWLQIPMILVAIAWFCYAFWRILDWQDHLLDPPDLEES